MIYAAMILGAALGVEKAPASTLPLLAMSGQPPWLQSSARSDRYEYDALGRLVKVVTEVDSQAQNEARYAYDPAGNRSQQTTVTALPAAISTHAHVVVVPLAGFTIIPIQTKP